MRDHWINDVGIIFPSLLISSILSWHEKYCCENLPRENRCRSSPKYCCQSRPEKWLPNLTKNVATRAAQRELLPKLTKILLSKLSREIAAKSQQNIAAKAAQRKNMGRFLAKPKQPRQQMEPTPSHINESQEQASERLSDLRIQNHSHLKKTNKTKSIINEME